MQHLYDSIIVESKTGERLEDIWTRVHSTTPSNDLTAIENRTWDFNAVMVKYRSLDARYDFSPRVPSLLHVNHALREESREAFGKLTKEMLALAKAQNDRDVETYSDQYHDYLLTKWARRGANLFNLTRGDVTKAREGMHRSAADMVRNTLHWHALRHICELLEL